MTAPEILKLAAESYQRGQLDLLESMKETAESPLMRALAGSESSDYLLAVLGSIKRRVMEESATEVMEKIQAGRS